MKKISFILILLILLSGIGLGYMYFLTDDKQVPELVTFDIEGSINEIGELATAEYGFTIAQTAEKPKKTVAGFKVPFTGSKVIYSYEGLIKTGVNFNDIEVNVNTVDKTIYVKLPDLKILSSEVDFESLIVYDEKYSPFNTFTFSDMNLSLSDLKKTAEASAIKNGLLDRGEANAKHLILTSIRAIYDKEAFDVIFY